MRKKSKKKAESALDRRRYERVPMALDWEDLQPLLGAIVHWPNHETSAVFDLSYFGMALGRPALLSLAPDQFYELQIDLGRQASLGIQVRVAWLKDNAVGAELMPLDVEARQAFDEFLEDRLIGSHLRLVDRRYYAPGAEFSVWYHGPQDTNVFLWQETDGSIARAEIELDGRILIYDGNQVLSGGASPRSLTDEIGSGTLMEVPDLPAVLEPTMPIVRRTLSILSQIEEVRSPLRKLLGQLAKLTA